MKVAELLLLVYHHLPSLIGGIIGIGAVITVHEFGHFIFGKLFNVHIPEFSIGVGPKLYKKKIGETTFCLSAIPVGAYVAADQDPITAGGHERTIQAKSYAQKVIIVAGGILFNLLFAYLLLVGLSTRGIPASPLLSGDHLVEKVITNSPAQKAGLCPHDKIIKINGVSVEQNLEKLMTFITEHPNTPVTLDLIREGKPLSINCTLASKTDENKITGSLGVQFTCEGLKPTSLSHAFMQAATILKVLVVKNFTQIGHVFKKKSAKNLSGPLGMLYMAVDSASRGFSYLLMLLVLINVGLAVLNVLPLPILDGGHLLIYTVEAITGKPLNETAKEYISYVALALFITLFAYLTFQDTIRIFFS